MAFVNNLSSIDQRRNITVKQSIRIVSEIKESDIIQFDKLKVGEHGGRKWLLAKYRGQRFLFNEDVLNILDLDLSLDSFRISKDKTSVVKNAKGLFIKAKTPIATMKNLMNLKHRMHKGLLYAELEEYLAKSKLKFDFSKSSYGEHLTIGYGAGYARNESDSVKIFGGNSVNNVISETNLHQFLINNATRIKCKSFLTNEHSKKIDQQVNRLKETIKKSVAAKTEIVFNEKMIGLIHESNYHRFYLQKQKNYIKNNIVV